MRYPKRPESHVIEAESWRLLQQLAPQNWIVREVSERDYGIDAYIELVSENGSITGKLMSVQLKGAKKINWKRLNKMSHEARSPSIESKTARYWLGMPVPVFLFVADLSAKNIYFAPTEEHIRKNFDSLEKQDTITFRLYDQLNLESSLSLEILEWLYDRERMHDQYIFHLTNLICQVDAFGEFILTNQNLDSFLEVETERHLQFRALHETCRMVSFYFDNKCEFDSLNELYEKDYQDWNDGYCILHEGTLDKSLKDIERIFPNLVRKVVTLVSEKQAGYWRKKDYFFFELCNNGEVMRGLDQFEGQSNR